MILRHVPPAQIKERWPRVVEGLKRIGEPDWLPEDVYHLLRTPFDRGGAVLTLVGDDGFIVWQRYPGDDGRGMLFVIACAGDLEKHYPQVYEELDALAREIGCARIRHISPRKGWERRGWTMKGYVYERAL